MRAEVVLTALPLLAASTVASGGFYTLANSYVGYQFLEGFQWETIDDPTNGRVNYVNQSYALETNLTYVTEDVFVMRADYQNVVPADARGRNSVRINSNLSWEDAVFVLDIEHMPQGCATWPAFWTLSQQGPWPAGGEIDIIEGVNLQAANLVSLHTTANCTMAENRTQLGYTESTDCDAYDNGNQGCGVTVTKSNSYGSAFNAIGGGYYVMQKSPLSGINVWFWPRDSSNLPQEIITGALSDVGVDLPFFWGEPDASFPTTPDNCDYSSHFNAHEIVFDLTLCGDWAGAVFSTSGCSTQSCNDYVDDNPADFIDAYWQINSLSIYTLQWLP